MVTAHALATPRNPPDREHHGVLAEVAGYAHSFLTGDRPVRARHPDRLADLLGGPLPDTGHPELATVQRLISAGEAGALASGAARSFGYAVGGALPVGVAADWLTSVWDQCDVFHDLSPLSAVAEEVCERWLVDLLGLPAGTVMGLTSGCTTANLVCLAAAREHQLHRAGWAVNERGMTAAPALTVLVGKETHISVLRCLRLLGLGGAIRHVEADDEGRMEARHLRELAAGATGGLIVCGQVGSTNCGSVDPLREIADITHEHGGWLHLDGAFGLWAAASPRHRAPLDGVERADSWSCDGHKWLNTPYDSGLAFCARPEPFHQAVGIQADYIHSTERTGRDPMNYRVEMSQRARSLTLWAVLHHLGRQGIADLVDRNCAAARHLARRLGAEPGVDVLVPVRLNQVLLRIGDDAHTRRVVEQVNSEGACWVTPTQWKGRGAVRLSVCSWRTDEAATEPAVAAFLAAHRARPGSAPAEPLSRTDPVPHMPAPRWERPLGTNYIHRPPRHRATAGDAVTYEMEPTDDVDEVADILTAAFHEDPVIGWMVPHTLAGRERYVRGFMHAWVGFMVGHGGTALMSPGRDAALVWEPSAQDAPVTDAEHRAFEAAITDATGPAAERCRQLVDLLDTHYPTDLPPHVHGALAAVRPGAAPGAFLRLAAGMLLHLYRNGLGVYCEASSDSSAALWQRFGSLPIRPPILLPGTGIELTPLFMHPDDIARHPALPMLLGEEAPQTA